MACGWRSPSSWLAGRILPNYGWLQSIRLKHAKKYFSKTNIALVIDRCREKFQAALNGYQEVVMQ